MNDDARIRSILARIYPFNMDSAAFLSDACACGRSIFLKAGERISENRRKPEWSGVILSGALRISAKAQNSGVIVTDLTRGCWLLSNNAEGSENLSFNISARAETEIFYWKRSDFLSLQESHPALKIAVQRLSVGESFLQDWEIPSLESAEPVLFADRAHLMSISLKILVGVVAIVCGIIFCNRLFQFASFAPALASLIILIVIAILIKAYYDWSRNRLIITPKALFSVPGSWNNGADRIPFSEINRARIIPYIGIPATLTGRLHVDARGRSFDFPFVVNPKHIEALLKSFDASWEEQPSAEKNGDLTRPANDQRMINLGNPHQKNHPIPEDENDMKNAHPDHESESVIAKISFRAHWILGIQKTLKPVISLMVIALFGAKGLQEQWTLFIRYPATGKIMFLIGAALIFWILYEITDWINDIYEIDVDCVRDINRKPFAKEEINLIMMKKIESVRFRKEGILQLAFDYGTLFVSVGDSELSFNYISHPAQVQKMLMDRIAAVERKDKLDEESRQNAYISNLVATIQRYGAENKDCQSNEDNK